MLSEKTLLEMKRGARTRAMNTANAGVTPEEMDALIRVQQRAYTLQRWANLGLISIGHTKRYTSQTDPWYYVVRVLPDGPEFTTEHEPAGVWPSELMFAQIAMALTAQGKV